MARLRRGGNSTPDLGRRKFPRQQRSEMTVQSILDATLEIAKAEGFLNLNSRRIAERAGVSSGSLYQYFPTVEAILLAIYEDAAAQVAKKFRERMLNLMHIPMELVGGKMAELLLSEYEKKQLVLHRLVIEVPQLTELSSVTSLDRLLRASMRIYFLQFRQLSHRDIERVTFFLDVIILGSVRNYLSDKPPTLSRKDFIADLNKAMVSYVYSQNWNLEEKAGLIPLSDLPRR